eukprot:1212371-Rhodomonas_salina.1
MKAYPLQQPGSHAPSSMRGPDMYSGHASQAWRAVCEARRPSADQVSGRRSQSAPHKKKASSCLTFNVLCFSQACACPLCELHS